MKIFPKTSGLQISGLQISGLQISGSPDPVAAVHSTVRRVLKLALAVIIIASAIMAAMMFSTAHQAMAATSAPVSLALKIFKEERKTAADGTTSVTLVAAANAVPGDRLIYTLSYSNTGLQPASGLVLEYPLPQGVTYRSAAEGSPAPLVSSDGVSFAPRIPSSAAVTALRWQIANDLAPGAEGVVSFKATFN